MSLLLKIAEAARLAGRDPRTIQRWCSKVPDLGVVIGTVLYVRRSVLERLINGDHDPHD